jgi:hypothetical protein
MSLSKIASYVFHPLFMTIIGVFIIFNSGIYTADLPRQYSHFVYLMVFLCNIILPVSIIQSMVYFRKIQDIKIDERHERILPLIFTTTCFYFCYFTVARSSSSAIINLFLFSSTLVLFAIFLVSFFWKISIHMAGIGGVTGLTFFLMQYYRADIIFILCAVILIAGVISSARLASGSHTWLQLLAGYLIGFSLIFGMLIKFLP